jgi:small nuclear ribonucleoprotein (snRNP)-like protein
MPRCRLAPTLAIAAALCSAGCTFWGFVVGTHVDSKGEKTRPLAGWQIEKIGKGEKILVRLRDGREVAGEFQGTEASTADYAVRHAAAVERLRPVALPGIGESVTVKLTEGKFRSGSLVGFEPTRVLLESPNSKAPLAKVLVVSWAAGAVTGAQLLRLARDGALPMLSRLVVGAERVPIEQVALVEAPRHHAKGRVVGTLIGAAVDVALIAAAVSAGFGDITFDEGVE